MGYTVAEFKKALFGQFAQHSSYQVEEQSAQHFKVTAQDDLYFIDIEIEKAPPRKIAMLSLPVLKTTFRFSEVNDERQSDFFRVFFKYFHKGGG